MEFDRCGIVLRLHKIFLTMPVDLFSLNKDSLIETLWAMNQIIWENVTNLMFPFTWLQPWRIFNVQHSHVHPHLEEYMSTLLSPEKIQWWTILGTAKQFKQETTKLSF